MATGAAFKAQVVGIFGEASKMEAWLQTIKIYTAEDSARMCTGEKLIDDGDHESSIRTLGSQRDRSQQAKRGYRKLQAQLNHGLLDQHVDGKIPLRPREGRQR